MTLKEQIQRVEQLLPGGINRNAAIPPELGVSAYDGFLQLVLPQVQPGDILILANDMRPYVCVVHSIDTAKSKVNVCFRLSRQTGLSHATTPLCDCDGNHEPTRCFAIGPSEWIKHVASPNTDEFQRAAAKWRIES